MALILKKDQLSEQIFRLRLEAPYIAKKRKAGQFIILRVTSDGERIPLTIANGSAEEGWIEIIVQAVGASTRELMAFNVGDSVADLVGPLGMATHVKNYGRCLCVGGGLGAAPLLPMVAALYEAGNDVTTILGSRNKDLLILEDEMNAVSNRVLVATDDGTYGKKGLVTDYIKELFDAGERFDFCVIVGPPIMMKFTSLLTVAAGIHTIVSLNPIMIDGTGMCGGCRVTVDGKTKFACVDGPEFDAAGVDWDELLNRLSGYNKIEEKNKSHACRVGLNG